MLITYEPERAALPAAWMAGRPRVLTVPTELVGPALPAAWSPSG